MKQIYELNLPPITELFTDSFSGYDDDNLVYNYVVENNLSKIIKPDWHNFLNLPWFKLIYFKKQDRKGSIHSDAYDTVDTIRNDNNVTIWGINWVHSGNRTMSYWYWDNVMISGTTLGSLNQPKHGVVTRFYEKQKEPDEVYHMSEGKAYLLNATLPHCATGEGAGKVFSYRANILNLEWPKVVDLFADYII